MSVEATERDPLAEERQLLAEAQQGGFGRRLKTYAKLTGPGFLQSAITLGGGSLAGSLYLGVIAGYQLMWLQPLMMLLGVVMLSAIGYVALSSTERPFDAINKHVSPVLGWGWVIATLMANLVWAMPQFSLGTAALQQNLFPELLSGEVSKYLCVVFLFLAAGAVIWFYDSGGWGIRLFEVVLKIMVAVIVLSFFGVVVAMSTSEEGLPWSTIFAGFVPDPSLFFEPADRFQEILPLTSAPEFWRGLILASQRDVMVTAAATAVGINMTFLLPYSMLKRGWGRRYRGLAVFDLSTGLFIPFLLATSCVVIASASRFHAQYDPGLVGEGPRTELTEALQGAYDKNIAAVSGYLAEQGAQGGSEAVLESALSVEDRYVAAMLVQRDAFHLANSLEELTGRTIAQTVFGIGVLGMAISTIIILMLINGFTVCEMLGVPSRGFVHRLGCYLPGFTGALGFLWLWGDSEARFWLAVPTSVFGMALLPIAYVTFFMLMNSRAALGADLPRGGKRIAINTAMLVALAAATIGAGWSIWGRQDVIPGTYIMVRWVGVALVVGFIALAILVHFLQRGRGVTSQAE